MDAFRFQPFSLHFGCSTAAACASPLPSAARASALRFVMLSHVIFGQAGSDRTVNRSVLAAVFASSSRLKGLLRCVTLSCSQSKQGKIRSRPPSGCVWLVSVSQLSSRLRGVSIKWQFWKGCCQLSHLKTKNK